MVNIGIKQLAIELTRWCQQQCPICLRGERENVFIDKEIIDRFFEHPEYKINFIDSLFLTGGEPTLALEQFRYLVYKLKELGIEVNRCRLLTNGLEYNEDFFNELALINEVPKSKLCSCVGISADQFHKIPSKQIIDKYALNGINYIPSVTTDILNIGLAKINNLGDREFDYNRALEKIKGIWVYSDKIFRENIYVDSNDVSKGVYSRGYAEDKFLCTLPETFEESMQSKHLALMDVFLNARGYISSYCDGEYIHQDKCNLGNIKTSSLLSMYQEPPYVDYFNAKNLAIATSKIKRK